MYIDIILIQVSLFLYLNNEIAYLFEELEHFIHDFGKGIQIVKEQLHVVIKNVFRFWLTSFSQTIIDKDKQLSPNKLVYLLTF